jgi:dihydrofolate reductase
MTGHTLLSMSVSLDGFAAGPDVTVENPMGIGGERLHEWLFQADADVDAEQARELSTSTGAVVVGRRTFDIGVGLWQDTPFPVPCFVLTHEPREELVMKSASFTFVTDGVEEALRLARQAAGDRNVLVMGGPATARQYVRLVDEIRLQLVPVILGNGTRLFEDLDAGHIKLEPTAVIESPRVTHLRYRVQSPSTRI